MRKVVRVGCSPRVWIALAFLAAGALGTARLEARAEEDDDTEACETGILDAGENGMNVLGYELCPGALTLGFESSEIIEEMTCGPGGRIRLWLVRGPEPCVGRPSSDQEETYELFEPLRGIGRSTARPVRQLLSCSAGAVFRSSIVVPDARAAILETRRGDTSYEKLARRFVESCVFRGAGLALPWRATARSRAFVGSDLR
jgi:hypothetical protein